jgi:gliding motility-associated-like protein
MKKYVLLLFIATLYNFGYCQGTDEKLILYLPFNNNALDASGNNHTVQLNGTSFTTDRDGNTNSALYFDGVDDYVDILNAADLNFGLSDFTISMWLKFPPQVGNNSIPAGRVYDYAAIFVKAANPNYPYEGITFFVDWPQSGDVHLRTSYIHGLSVTNTNGNNYTWHYYVLRRRGSELSIYIDGVLKGKVTHSMDNTSNTSGIRLGANHVDKLSQNFNGVMDELKIYTKALPDEDLIPKKVAIQENDFEACFPGQYTLTASAGFTSYLWSTGETTSSIQITKPGNYSVTAKYYEVTSSDNITVTKHDCNLYLPADTAFCDPVQGVVKVPQGFDSYKWSTGETTHTATIVTPGWLSVEARFGTTIIKDSVFVIARDCNLYLLENTIVCLPVNEVIKVPPGFHSYKWSSGETTSSIIVKKPGWVSVEARLGSTIVKDSILIIGRDCKLYLPDDTVFCYPIHEVIEVPHGFDSYQWSTGEKTRSITVLKPGWIFVEARFGNTITKDSIHVIARDCNLYLPDETTVCSPVNDVIKVPQGFHSYKWNTGETTHAIKITKPGWAWVEARLGSTIVKDSIFVMERDCNLYLPKDTTFCYPIHETLKVPEGFHSYRWDTGETTTVVTITKPGWIWIEARYGNTVIKDSVFVNAALCSLGVIPNVITPNDDNLNSTFQLPESLYEAEIVIYNRWGKKIYSSIKYQNDWKGESGTCGVYFYKIKLPLLNFETKGWIEVIR